MLVSVPNAPDVPETSKMLEDVDHVSIAPPAAEFSNADCFVKAVKLHFSPKLTSGFVWALDDVV